MRFRDKYDWETMSDAQLLKDYADLRSNPERMKAAKNVLADEISVSKSALGIKVPNVPSRCSNPATIAKLEQTRF